MNDDQNSSTLKTDTKNSSKRLQKKLLYLAAMIELIVACSCGLNFPCGVPEFLVTYKK